jgi:acetylornithine deacetylase/succinyl-diaminopimelate desuccinylase-like protein
VDVVQDSLYNVYGRIRGHSSGPALLVSAHTDTVFAATTDLTVKADDTNHRLYGPGIGDNAAGVAALLALAQASTSLAAPPVDIWFAANSCEEGLGDLRGMRAVIDRLETHLGACVVIEGMGLGRIVHRALGSHRFRISVEAPGGHSWSDYGSASAIHILTRLAADLTRLTVPDSPRTTFNIGRIDGGTSVNTIAQNASLELDLRSEETGVLRATTAQVLELVNAYQTPEWERKGVTVRAETIGDRPSGAIHDDHPLVLAAIGALQACGLGERIDLRISSTDANIPLSRGLPAVCVGATKGGNAHRLQEWISTEPFPQGIRHLMLLTWWCAAWLAGEIETP